ncbi:FAD-dependent oxidoreductase [Halopseudomonas sabulinigri]|uniref:FAD-dependent oxidoreductase n=1 Tax=Halopseudomonas sabulinigri TaxID=472181 RepID=A0ABP9ZM83_9GAMM
MPTSTPQAPLIMVGGGHAHLVALRQWIANGQRAPAGSLLVNAQPYAWYSGMLPGLLAGRFTAAQCSIELAPLAAVCGMQLICDELLALDAHNQAILLASGKRMGFARLSLNSGALPVTDFDTDGSLPLVGAKPFPGIVQQWRTWQAQPPAHLAILGGGPAGVELALALRLSLPQTTVSLFCRHALLISHPLRLARLARARLGKANVKLHEKLPIERISDGQLYSDGHAVAQPDAVVLATGAAAADWQATSGLECDAQGFIRIDAQLRSSHPCIFAAGDCASLPDTPHAGVYAVRQGPVLAHNLLAAAQGNLQHYQPQPRALALLACGDGRALLSYGALATQGRLAGQLKDWLDLRFMRAHRLPAQGD